MYWLRNDPNTPPETEDAPNKHKENDPLGLEQRFYRFDIKPEWLQIVRLLDFCGNSRHYVENYWAVANLSAVAKSFQLNLHISR